MGAKSCRSAARRAVAWVLVPVAISTGAFLGTPRAAAEFKVVMVNTGSGNLNVRSAPTVRSELLGTIRNGTRMTITCYVRGEVFVGGPFGGRSDIWNRRQGGGFATDRLLDTGSDDPVVPPCVGSDAQYGPTRESMLANRVLDGR